MLAASDARSPWCARCLYSTWKWCHCSTLWGYSCKISFYFFIFLYIWKKRLSLEILWTTDKSKYLWKFWYLSQCRQHLELLLENIPSMFQNNKIADSAFGAAVKVCFSSGWYIHSWLFHAFLRKYPSNLFTGVSKLPTSIIIIHQLRCLYRDVKF